MLLFFSLRRCGRVKEKRPRWEKWEEPRDSLSKIEEMESLQDVKFRADEDEYIKDEVRRSKIRICKDISFDQDQELSSQDWSSEEDLEKSSLLSKIKKKKKEK